MSGHITAFIAGVGLAVAILARLVFSGPLLYAVLAVVASVALGPIVGALLRGGE